MNTKKVLIGSRKIHTEHIYPPIPIRSFDWAASRDGFDEGEIVGYGETELEAIKNLIQREYEEGIDHAVSIEDWKEGFDNGLESLLKK